MKSVKSCYDCKWLSDFFNSVCTNASSEHCADFVYKTDLCSQWEQRLNFGQDVKEPDGSK